MFPLSKEAGLNWLAQGHLDWTSPFSKSSLPWRYGLYCDVTLWRIFYWRDEAPFLVSVIWWHLSV